MCVSVSECSHGQTVYCTEMKTDKILDILNGQGHRSKVKVMRPKVMRPKNIISRCLSMFIASMAYGVTSGRHSVSQRWRQLCKRITKCMMWEVHERWGVFILDVIMYMGILNV